MTNRGIMKKMQDGTKVSRKNFERLERRLYKIRHEIEQLDDLLKDCYVPCHGEVHFAKDGYANGMIDNCSLCAPRWGKRPDPEKVWEDDRDMSGHKQEAGNA